MSESKWVNIVEQKVFDKRKTKIYAVLTNDYYKHNLGFIKWYPQWRQYAFFPNNETLYNQECMHHIADFTEFLNVEHKHELAKKRGEAHE